VPNARAKNRVSFGIALDKELFAQIDAEAKRLGLDRSAFIVLAVKDKIERNKKKLKNQKNEKGQEKKRLPCSLNLL